MGNTTKTQRLPSQLRKKVVKSQRLDLDCKSKTLKKGRKEARKDATGKVKGSVAANGLSLRQSTDLDFRSQQTA